MSFLAISRLFEVHCHYNHWSHHHLDGIMVHSHHDCVRRTLMACDAANTVRQRPVALCDTLKQHLCHSELIEFAFCLAVWYVSNLNCNTEYTLHNNLQHVGFIPIMGKFIALSCGNA